MEEVRRAAGCSSCARNAPTTKKSVALATQDRIQLPSDHRLASRRCATTIKIDLQIDSRWPVVAWCVTLD
jgi:hypothetical protein